jgi:hypothetical protein
MYYIDDIYQEIASKYVLKGNDFSLNEEFFYNANEFSGPKGGIKNKIYGVAQSRREGNNVLEVYYDKTIPFEKISNELSHYSRNLKIYPYPTNKFKTFQLEGGDAIAHTNLVGYGTLGGFVLDALSNQILILSNNHVIANSNNAIIGDAIVDSPQRQNIGRLEGFEPLLIPPNRNIIDAALGSIAKKHFNGVYADHRHTPARPQVGMKVYKIGATTGLTYGTIISINGAITVDYRGLGIINFVNTLVIRGDGEPFSMPGDSGSFIINGKGYLVGIVFAGDPNGSISFGNSIGEIVNLLGIRF